MKVIVGLGNPGKEYQKTRHNLGFMVLDKMAEEAGVKFTSSPKTHSEMCKLNATTLLCKPQTFMNNSGLAVRELLEYYKLFSSAPELPSLYVVHDDLDLLLGSYKIQLGTGPKAHNGLLSLYDHLGSKLFWHVRGGVDNRGELRNQLKPSDYVLENFTTTEEHILLDEIASIVTELKARV